MNKTFQYIILLVLPICLVRISTFGQDCSKQDHLIKARIILVDSIALENIRMDGVTQTMYKFKVDKLFYGEYNCPFIYVTLYEGGNDIYQFNPFKNTGKEYWWGLIKSENQHIGIPIYQHSGNF